MGLEQCYGDRFRVKETRIRDETKDIGVHKPGILKEKEYAKSWERYTRMNMGRG